MSTPEQSLQEALEFIEGHCAPTCGWLEDQHDKFRAAASTLRAALTASQELPLLQKSFAELQAERKANREPQHCR